MIKYLKVFITILFAVVAIGANAQSTATTSSPYSQYGLGDLDPALLTQNIGMGGIATAINNISLYNNINPLNPASYAKINFTTIDAGIYSNTDKLSQMGQPNAYNSNFRLSHVAFAIPVTTSSALSFGIMPYSEMGYNYNITKNNFSAHPTLPADTAINNVYSGEGGLSKAYLGYGFTIAKHLYLGANVSYIFGDLQQSSSTQIPTLYGMLNPLTQQDNAIGGVNYDYGLQYSFDFGEYSTKHLVLGYAASANTSLTSTTTYIVSQFTYTSTGTANVAADSVVNSVGTKSKIKLPQINHFGISFQNDGHFLIGADYTMGHWSSLSTGGSAYPNIQNSQTFNFGGQYTPNITALHNYFARMDYRVGFTYDQTYLNLNNTNIDSHAFTVGLGFPLAPNNVGATFYKINFAAEVGQRGTLANGLVKENYVNFHLSFMLSDKWFQKYKFE